MKQKKLKNETKMVGVRLPSIDADRLEKLVSKTGLSKTHIVHRALVRAMDSVDQQIESGANPKLVVI